jgi:hypothetical protein
VSALDAKIDDLYQLPLGEFTAARNALAKSLAGDEAKRVKALEKPTVVPWAVNQVYWRARSTYDRVMKSGEKVRAAQIAALEGRAADVRAATEAHRHAIADAVAEAERLSAASGAQPGVDALARTFESLSLATSAPQTPGRLTEALQPAGFEALAGVTDIKVRTEKSEGGTGKSEVKSGRLEVVKPAGDRQSPKVEPRTTAAARAAERAAEKEAARLAAEREKYEAAVKAAEAELARVQRVEQSARETWEHAHDDLLAARQALTDLRRSRFKRPGAD